MTRSLAMLLFCIVCLEWVLAAESSSPNLHATVEAQIKRLRSPNKAPRMDFYATYPPGYVPEAQEAVRDAQLRLFAMGKDAFPMLLAHGDDKDYSLTFSSAQYVDYSVGEVCLSIIECQVDIAPDNYKSRKGVDGKSHHPGWYFSKYHTANGSQRSALQKWYEENKAKTLTEIQIEVLEWRIEQEKRFGFPEEDDQKHCLIPLERQLAELRQK